MSEVLDPVCSPMAWIAPLEIEARASPAPARPSTPRPLSPRRGDDYIFHAGDMCGHNIVIATLPAGQEYTSSKTFNVSVVYGTGSAAAPASQVKKSFPNLWFGLLAGVAAGLPRPTGDPPRDIRLGFFAVKKGYSKDVSASLAPGIWAAINLSLQHHLDIIVRIVTSISH
ncbi:hypothetical protein MFIFM68171_09751 [Madurella fahalii]|uniref:Uncharacterized protein n=1 Tax=Madurella fahalii TaxID=1157608 RepID=A0ABQ0GP87_9PEZI